MTKLSKILLFLVCFLTSGTWLTQAHGQAILANLAPVNTGATTGARGPNGTVAAMRGVAIVRPAELTPLLGAVNTIQTFGFTLNNTNGVGTTPSASFGGTVNIYMLNTTDITNTKGLDWTVATTGMTQVCTACAFTVPANAVKYDITLAAPFAYTGQGMYVAYDFTVTVPTVPLTVGASYLANNSLAGGVSTYQGTAPASNTLGTSAFRPEFRFGVTNPFATDNIVARVIAPGKMPLGNRSAFNQIKATILNRGINNLATPGLAVTLTVTGANPFTNTQTIPSLVAGEDAVVTFSAFTPTVAGTNNVTVSIAADSNPNPNNSLSVALETTCTTFSYANNVAPLANNGIGFGIAGGILLNKFKTSVGSSVTINAVNITISDNVATTANVISAVLVDPAGTILATSATYTVLAADLGTVKNFTFSPAIVIPAGAQFLAGLIQSAATVAYAPLASQTIVSPVGFAPAQSNIVPVDTDVLFAGTQPAAGVTTLTAQTLNVRLMIEVVVNSPIVAPTITGATTACAGTTVALTSSAPSNWYATAISTVALNTAGATASFTTPALTATTTYFVETPSATPGGCNSPRTSYTVTVTDPSVTGVGAAVCTGSAAVTISASLTNAPATGTPVFSWFAALTGGTALNTGASFTTPALTATTNYFVSATVNGCTTPIRVQVTVTVGTPVTPTVTASVASVCGTGNSILTATNVPASATVSWYTVATGGTAIAGTTGNTFTATATGTYFAEYALGTCVGARNAGTTFTISALPSTAVIAGSATPAIASNSVYTVPTETGITYVWSANGGGTVASGQGTNSATITWATAGAKAVSVVRTNAATCATTNTLAVTVTVVIDPATAVDNALSNSVKVSPNPSNGDFTVNFGGINMSKSVVRVYDAQGQTVFSSEVKGNLMTISLDKFANGIYLMEVVTSKGSILKRLAKQ